MKKEIKYLVKRYEQNPFDFSFNTPVFGLLEVVDGQPVEVERFPILNENDKLFKLRNIKEGDILTSNDVKIREESKKTKHLVPKDSVVFGGSAAFPIFTGTIVEIIENEHDEYYDDIFVLTNCKVIENEFLNEMRDKKNLTVEKDMRVLRRDLAATHWLTADVNCPCCGNF